MEQYVVKGGVPLCGEVSIGGAKNAALGILAAAIMTDEPVTIENVPNVRDTKVLLQAIEGIGAKVNIYIIIQFRLTADLYVILMLNTNI